MKVVGVIGAGAAGLCAARHIQAMEGMNPMVWEQSSDIGGTWRLSEDIGTDGKGLPVHSSMYNNLRTDLPKLIMNFPDFEFPDGGESFPHHTTVLKYLEDYADRYNLRQFIRFGSHVEDVSPMPSFDDGPPAWAVTVKDLASGTVSTMTCDAILVCNGHFSVPMRPEIEGSDTYKGRVLHSHDYREPSAFKGKKVVVLGSGASGLDITMDLASVADEVLLSHNFPVSIPTQMPPNVRQVCGIEKATEDGFIFKDGSSASADAIIFCTGYKYNFPFLSEECDIAVEQNQVKHLYKQIINAAHPTMGFIGIPSRIIVFPLLYYQVHYFLASLTGKVLLPTSDVMIRAVEYHAEERRKADWPDKHFHILQDDQFPYIEELAEAAGLAPPPAYLKEVWTTVITRLLLSFPDFRTYNYQFYEDGTIKETHDGMILKTSWDLVLLTTRQTVWIIWSDFFRLMKLLQSILIKKAKAYVGIKNVNKKNE